MKEEEKSICWLGIIPECDKDKVRYPTDEEIDKFIEEAENEIGQDDLKPRNLVHGNKIWENYILHVDGRLMRQYKSTPEVQIKQFQESNLRYTWHISENNIKSHIGVSVGKALTFPELVGRSPLVRHFDLQFGDDVQIVLPNGDIIRLIVSVDHINQDCTNDDYGNLRFCTSFEQKLNTGPRIKGRKHGSSRFKAVSKEPRSQSYRSSLSLLGEKYPVLNFKTEEEAALTYNRRLENALKNKFGNKLAQQLIDEVAYFNDAIPKQQELDF